MSALRRTVSATAAYGQAALWPVLAHLALVSVAGSRRVLASPPLGPEYHFRVLIPARDEERLIGAAVESVLTGDYPEHLRGVIVVADNSSDATASVARASGAEVWERSDLSSASKGAALEWAFDRMFETDDWDAVVILDADGRLDPRFLTAVNTRLLEGARVVQGERRVVNTGTNLVSWLSQVSSAAQWVLRPRGRARLGGAAKLLGSGMAIRRDVLEECPWRASGLAEDVEYWLALLTHGIHPVQEPAAVICDVAPTDLAAARVQRSRWEAGKVSALGDHFSHLARLAFRRRDPVLAEAFLSELVFPNLSVTGALIGGTGAVRWLVQRQGARPTAVQAGVLVAHLALALRAAEAPPRAYAALLLSPIFAIWRLWVTVEATLTHRRLQWRGTRRDPALAGAFAVERPNGRVHP